MYTLADIAELTGIYVNTLKRFVNYHPQKSRFFRKDFVPVKVLTGISIKNIPITASCMLWMRTKLMRSRNTGKNTDIKDLKQTA